MKPYRQRLAVLLPTAAFLCAISAVHAQSSPAAPPVAPVRPVTDTYFGTIITDPYRWMEDLNSPEVKTWFQGQADSARQTLDKIPGRETLLAQIKVLDGVGTSVSEVQIVGSRYFFEKTRPQDNSPKLYVRDGLSGPDTLLFDPEPLTKGGIHYSIDYFAPSNDGKYVVYALSPGGSEQSVIHIKNIVTGKDFAETIDRARFGGVSWRPDDKAFFYDRQQPLTPGFNMIEDEQKVKVFLHLLGTDPAKDTPILGYGLSSTMPLTVDDTAYIAVPPDSHFALAVITHGVQNEQTVYVAPASSVTDTQTPWRKIADVSDDVTNMASHGDTLFLLSHKNASRYQILSVSLANPDLSKAAVIVPEGQTVITGLGPAQDALYVQSLDGGISRLLRVSYGRGKSSFVPLPYAGAVNGLVTDYKHPGAVFLETSWTHSALWYTYDPNTNQVADTRLKPLSPVDFSAYTSVEVKAKSADGTLVPLSIVYKKGIVLDGSHPTLLDGYGSYGETISPYFDPTLKPWLDQGGIYAESHVRGGGENGEDWHLGGQKLTKHHTWEDFIACGEYLIAHGYTANEHLAGEGTSAGGITIGRAITEYPSLFRAALIRVGSSNPLRSEFSPNGPSNIPEFGTVNDADGFQALYAMDAYLHVKDGVGYPAVMVETGINDPRVASWEPAKMAARLQAATVSRFPVLLRVDYDAGHGMGSTKSQDDLLLADEYAFLLWQLGNPAFQPKAPNSIKTITPITVTGE